MKVISEWHLQSVISPVIHIGCQMLGGCEKKNLALSGIDLVPSNNERVRD